MKRIYWELSSSPGLHTHVHACNCVASLHKPEGEHSQINVKSWSQEAVLSNELVFYRPLSSRKMVTLNSIGVNCLWTLGCMVSFCLLFMESTESVVLGCSPLRRCALKYCIPLVRSQLSMFLSGKRSVRYCPTASSTFSLRGCGRVQNWGFWLPLFFKHKIKPLEFGEAFVGGRTLSSPSNTSLRIYSANSLLSAIGDSL